MAEERARARGFSLEACSDGNLRYTASRITRYVRRDEPSPCTEPPLQSATHRPLNLYYTRWKSPATATPSELQHLRCQGSRDIATWPMIARFPRSCTWKPMHTFAACLSSKFRYRLLSHDRSVPFQPFFPLRASRYAACRENTLGNRGCQLSIRNHRLQLNGWNRSRRRRWGSG